MRLTEGEALERLAAADHAVLSTVHPERGVDAVPVVHALIHHGSGHFVGIPIDRVKPKADRTLQRERNLNLDPRACLLVEHWDATDWTTLWWVRAHLEAVSEPAPDVVEMLSEALSRRYPQYADRPFARVLVHRVTTVTGWQE